MIIKGNHWKKEQKITMFAIIKFCIQISSLRSIIFINLTFLTWGKIETWMISSLRLFLSWSESSWLRMEEPAVRLVSLVMLSLMAASLIADDGDSALKGQQKESWDDDDTSSFSQPRTKNLTVRVVKLLPKIFRSSNEEWWSFGTFHQPWWSVIHLRLRDNARLVERNKVWLSDKWNPRECLPKTGVL